MMKHFIKLFIVLLFFIAFNAHAQSNDTLLFDKLFKDWTDAFNQKDVAKSCALFSKSIVADYQGVPQKNYQSICDGFKTIFKDKNRAYRYQYKLHQVNRSDNLATVRITWYLYLTENGKKKMISQDEGIDVLIKNSQDDWKIVNYVAYPVKSR